MKTTDLQNLKTLVTEMQYRDMESMQPSIQKFKAEYDKKNSTGVWSGMTDPSKGPSMYTPSVDEEQVSEKEKIKNLIQQEINNAPKRMTYARRVLRSLLKKVDSI